MLIRRSLGDYLKKLASDSPAPGGGSASALVGAAGVSLFLMSAQIAREKLVPSERSGVDQAIRILRRALKRMTEIIDLDVEVYERLMASYRDAKRIKSGGKTAPKRIETALTNAFRLQADLAMLVLMAKKTLSLLRPVIKGAIASDLAVGEAFLDAAFRGAIQTANINLVYMKSERKSHFQKGLEELEKNYR